MKKIYKETILRVVDNNSDVGKNRYKKRKQIIQMESINQEQVMVEYIEEENIDISNLTRIEEEGETMKEPAKPSNNPRGSFKVKEISKEQIKETMIAYIKTVQNMQEVMEEIDTKETTIKKEVEKRGWVLLNEEATEPKRATVKSAGYDISIMEGGVIKPGETKMFLTGIGVRMPEDEYLQIHIRSSIGINEGVVLTNGTGIIDSDYRGGIIIALRNEGNEKFVVKDKERVAQGIFTKYLTCDGESITIERTGGIGSTGK